MDYEEFRRVVITPHWCPGNPLDFKDENIGPAYFAEQGKVGTFNLAWWTLERPSVPLPASVYRHHKGILWAVIYAPAVMIYGKPITDHAAFMKMEEFNGMLRHVLESVGHAPDVRQHIESGGMTVERLMYLSSAMSKL